MNVLDAIVLGVVEGVTEFLPVSSTGHLILTKSLLGLQGAGINAYLVVIQGGAILAVVAQYRASVLAMLRGLIGQDPDGRALFLKLLLAFIPAAIAGLLLDDLLDALLFHPIPVAVALTLGGAAMIAVERFVVRPRQASGAPLKELKDFNFVDALVVGCGQCLSLWPGMSRSMSTIVTAQLRGYSSVAAAEISFLLALPTLGAATLYKGLKSRHDLMALDNGALLLAVGMATAFAVAWLAVRWFVGVVTRHGMTPFGWYRIVVGLAFLGLWAAGLLAFPVE